MVMAMLGLGYPDSKYKECVEKLGVRRMMDQSREAEGVLVWFDGEGPTLGLLGRGAVDVGRHLLRRISKTPWRGLREVPQGHVPVCAAMDERGTAAEALCGRWLNRLG